MTSRADAYDDHDVTVRPPEPRERLAWRTLLPALTSQAAAPLLRVAVEVGGQGRVVGAAAVGLDAGMRVEGGAPLDVNVIPPRRRRGVARRLVEQAATAATAAVPGLSAVYSWPWFAPDAGGDARAWLRFGFEPWQHRYDYQTRIADAIEGVRPVYERLRVRGRIPASARVLRLRDAPIRAVVDLHVRCLGGTPATVLSLLDGSAADGFDPDISVVALDGRGDVIGLGLVRDEGERGGWTFDSMAIREDARGRWVMPLMRHEQLQRARAAGIESVRYFALDHHADTQAAAERLGAKLLRTRLRLRRPVSATPPTPAASGSQIGGA